MLHVYKDLILNKYGRYIHEPFSKKIMFWVFRVRTEDPDSSKKL